MYENDINQPFLDYDKEEEQNDYEIDKAIHEKVREGFISKVFGILCYQIFITSVVVYFALINSSFREYLLTSVGLFYTNIFLTFFLILLPICAPSSYRIVPLNYIILTIFTLSYSCLIAMQVCMYSVSSVMIALFLTLVTVITLSIYAASTKTDFTTCGGTLFVCLVLLIFSSIFLIFFNIPLLYLLLTYASLVIFSIYLIYDIQLIVGKGRISLSEDDYILAAINLYLDVIILFLKILSIFGEKK